ncbi:MAG TPA: GAF domain-containing protein, partial [Terriglobales bacterium]|nr:GAF domain-containing protein [Terriglobales bacterium]
MQSTASKKGSTSRVSGLLASLDLIAKASAELLCSSSNLESILPAILEIAQSLIAADGYAVWRIDESGAWSILASAGLSQSYAETVVANADIGKVSFPTSTVFIPNVFESELLTTRSRFHAAEHIQSLLLAPLLAGSNVI